MKYGYIAKLLNNAIVYINIAMRFTLGKNLYQEMYLSTFKMMSKYNFLRFMQH